ncbi:CoA-acylating methylmalonate-semialdehyde dehydrogenase [Leadbettera azotonutricia]|uniref:Methylmalonate-semialdehyde dehydrogenase (Acylating) n=1 Tax=Leadbettera azotonutricia (strain ATCC BAA-888 / DSM 13862 / ZAS-9) TaxID=545695 RepID=F5Y802_LEAAZ|nr:CoA-acylating methylmalonate-semialdehyde dehydrogenase [Leadbettera azotonutricia]AEF83037.1 methylmalonate-semialdehyde dehydrogenase (acylating) [Leadbettera azotonutricia ZAS-9]
MSVTKLKYCCNGMWVDSKTGKWMDVYDPSTGEVIAQAPCCTQEELQATIDAAAAAYKSWSKTPVIRRTQILFKFRDLVVEHMEELTKIVARENGKVWSEAEGDILKVKEPVELACGAATLMQGESLMNTSTGYDSVLYREPIGVFGGIVPFNFPGMIPFGWMAPLCIAAGNCIVLKSSSSTPMTSIRLLELLQEAGLPAGVVSVITTDRNVADLLLTNPVIKGICFVGTTSVGLQVYSKAAANGKRVQAQTEAKNHALVMDDAVLDRSAAGIINSAFGCAGERCMALPVVAAHENIHDKLVELLIAQAKTLKVGCAYDKASQLGPVVNKAHYDRVTGWIEKGIKEGAKLVLDGRGIKVPGFEKGFYLGPTIFTNVTEDMSIGRDEIFGPVLCVKKVKSFEEGVKVINGNPFANGAVIYTSSGYHARNFSLEIDGGMVGVNVGIPVPVGMFPFSGHKQSFFGDLHCLGKDGIRFFTESKVVTSTWFTEESANKKVDTWDGSVGG